MITLIFSTGSSFASRLIRWVTRSPVSHVSLGIEWYGYPLVLEASLGGVIPKSRVKWERSNKIVKEYLLDNVVSEDLSEVVGSLNQKYDYIGLLGYIPVLLYRWLGKRIKNPLSSAKSVVCSEFVLSLDPDRDKIPEWKDLDPETTTPKDLFDICLNNGRFKEIAHP